MSGSARFRGPAGLSRALAVMAMAGVLAASAPASGAADTPAERGVCWWGVAPGYGYLTQHSAVGQRPIDTFALDFLFGVPISRQVRCGVKLGGWLIRPDAPTSGRAFSNYLLIVDLQPDRRWVPFLRTGGGVSNFWTERSGASTAHAWGWGGTVGLGWDLAREARWLTPLLFEYSWGRPGNADRLVPELSDLRYQVWSVTAAMGGLVFPPAHTSPDEGMDWLGLRIVSGGALRIGGMHVLPEGTLDGDEPHGALAFGLDANHPYGERLRFGVGVDVFGGKVAMGVQSFGIVPVQVLARVEYQVMRRAPGPNYAPRPYAVLGAGWNFNSTGTSVMYPLGALPGIATGLELEGSPALRIGFGTDAPVNPGLALTAEAGWNWNTAGYRLMVSGFPDRTGDASLGGLFLMIGIALGGNHGGR